MRRFGTFNLAVATLALCGTAFAVDVTYECNGVDDNMGLADAIAAAGAGGSVAVSGDCVTTETVLINIEDLTLLGPAPPKSASSAACATSENLGASITNVGCGATIEILQGGSGATITGLAVINESAEGSSHVVTNGPNARVGCTGGPGALPGPLHQPDNVTISGNILTTDTGRCVSQYNHNGPPLNDTNRCAGFIDTSCGVPGAGGISTGWNIDGNTCTTVNGTGVLVTGNDISITNNCINSGDEGIRVQNNSCSSVPSVITFGAIPGASNITIDGNIIDVTFDINEGGYALGYIGLGYDFFTTVPEIDACQRARNVEITSNCMTLSDPDDAAGFVAGMQTQKENFLFMRGNEITMLPAPSAFGNAGVVNFGTYHSSWEYNNMTGADDYGLLTLNGDEVGNSFRYNRMGQGDIGVPFAPILDFGLADNLYVGNEFCDGAPFYGTAFAFDNQDGLWCDVNAGPAASCGGGRSVRGFAPEMSYAAPPVSFVGPPNAEANAAGARDRMIGVEMKEFYEDQGTLRGDNLTAPGSRDGGRSRSRGLR